MIEFEHTGWQQISIEQSTLDSVQRDLQASRLKIRELDASAYAQEFAEFVRQPCYAGEYRFYGGAADHCLLEKALEHFISFTLINPTLQMVGVDVGSCKSVAPVILREAFGCKCYEQDLDYAAGVHANRIGSSADNIPLPERSVDFMTLHCTYEHFEGRADTGFVRECARLLRPGACRRASPVPQFEPCQHHGPGERTKAGGYHLRRRGLPPLRHTGVEQSVRTPLFSVGIHGARGGSVLGTRARPGLSSRSELASYSP